MTLPFLQLVPTDNPDAWTLALDRDLGVGPDNELFMFGGVGLAAAAQALERSLAAPLLWATAQFLGPARPPERLRLQVRQHAAGRRAVQAEVLAWAGDRLVFRATGAVGRSGAGPKRQWLSPPPTRPPEASPPVVIWPFRENNLNGRILARLATEASGIDHAQRPASPTGRLTVWLGVRDPHIVDVSLLAVFADYAPGAVAASLGQEKGGSSLDNTLRIHELSPTRWVLLDTQVIAIREGVAQTQSALFSESGELLATASQTMLVRSGTPIDADQASI